MYSLPVMLQNYVLQTDSKGCDNFNYLAFIILKVLWVVESLPESLAQKQFREVVTVLLEC